MEERQVTIDRGTRKDVPSIPCSSNAEPCRTIEGTYRLPEAQLDRFLFTALILIILRWRQEGCNTSNTAVKAGAIS